MSGIGFLIYRIVKWDEIDEETKEKKCTPTKAAIGGFLLFMGTIWMCRTYGLI
jgi:hypothetical protein